MTWARHGLAVEVAAEPVQLRAMRFRISAGISHIRPERLPRPAWLERFGMGLPQANFNLEYEILKRVVKIERFATEGIDV